MDKLDGYIHNVENGIDTADNDAHNDNDNVVTGHALPLQTDQTGQTIGSMSNPQTIGQKRFQNIGKNTVSSIIGSYKSAVSKSANRLGFENGWQTRFYDHIIRNDAEYQRISNYIIRNPVNWKDDKFYTI